MEHLVQHQCINYKFILPKHHQKTTGDQSCDHREPPFSHLLLRNSLSMLFTLQDVFNHDSFGVLKQDYAKTTKRTSIKLGERMEKEPKMN